jgi:hypothetical protein
MGKEGGVRPADLSLIALDASKNFNSPLMNHRCMPMVLLYNLIPIVPF